MKIKFIGETDNLDGQNIKSFQVTAEGHQPVNVAYVVSNDYDTGAIHVSENDASTLPGINGALHLSACIAMTILAGFKNDHSFYVEQFFDEDGNAIERELKILPI